MKIEMLQKTCLIIFYLISLNGTLARFVQLRTVLSTALSLIKYHDWASKNCVKRVTRTKTPFLQRPVQLDSRTNDVAK